MELNNWKTLLNTCKTYDEFYQFININTDKIKQQNLLCSNYNVNSFSVFSYNFILKPNVVIEKKEVTLQQQKKEFKKRDTSDVLGLYLFEKINNHNKLKKVKEIQFTINNELIQVTDFIKTIYHDNNFVLNSHIIMQNNVYKKYFIKEFLLLCIYDSNLNLSDFDITQFKINNEAQTVTINNITIKINDINSIEIKNYCSSKLTIDDKVICKNILDMLYINNINYTYKKMIYIDMKMYKLLKSPHNKFLIVKYIFSNYHDLIEINNIKEILQDILKSHLIELIKQMIMTNNYVLLTYILNNKSIKLQNNDYKHLISISSNLKYIDTTKILFKYEAIDMF